MAALLYRFFSNLANYCPAYFLWGNSADLSTFKFPKNAKDLYGLYIPGPTMNSPSFWVSLENLSFYPWNDDVPIWASFTMILLFFFLYVWIIGCTIGSEISYAPGPIYLFYSPFFFFLERVATDPNGAYDWCLLENEVSSALIGVLWFICYLNVFFINFINQILTIFKRTFSSLTHRSIL